MNTTMLHELIFIRVHIGHLALVYKEEGENTEVSYRSTRTIVSLFCTWYDFVSL